MQIETKITFQQGRYGTQSSDVIKTQSKIMHEDGARPREACVRDNLIAFSFISDWKKTCECLLNQSLSAVMQDQRKMQMTLHNQV